jgi:SH3-like domain-containing protein
MDATLPASSPRRRVTQRVVRLFVLLTLALPLAGCSYFRQKAAERYVYVTARQTFLRERVAAVSNRTGTAYNGDKLVVLERARRFLKVRTPRGEVGWIEEKLTADQKTADQFAALKTDHANDPVVATATVRDEVYLHIAPGRETERFFRLAEGDNLSLLERASVPKMAPGATPVVEPAQTSAKAPEPAKQGASPAREDAPPPPPPVMEDWWLVRNSKGQTGWIYSRMIDVAEPDALARYAEGQRIVGSYVLEYANDPDSGILDNGNPVTRIPEYVAVLSPFKAGLPYDFDQVRVFTWNVKKHRYETSYREHNIVGYLPVQVVHAKNAYGHTPVDQLVQPMFTYRVLSADEPIPTPDPVTGLVKPGKLIEKTIRLEGALCRRILPPGVVAQAEAHPVVAAAKEKGKAKRKHKA